jgi:hypothetical protein
MRREHRDFAAEMLGVEFERLPAVAAVVEIGVELHAGSPFGGSTLAA